MFFFYSCVYLMSAWRIFPYMVSHSSGFPTIRRQGCKTANHNKEARMFQLDDALGGYLKGQYKVNY